MYFWLAEKTGSTLVASILSTLVYTLLILMITIFSELPNETFRYLEL